MSAITLNVIISGVSVSGDLDLLRSTVTVDLGNSDNIGMATFALQNKDGVYSAMLFSGHAVFQIDAMQGNTVARTVFRGTLERADPIVDTTGGAQTKFTGYDFGQELLGFVSPDARQYSKIDSSGKISLTSGDQGMGIITGMDVALYVSGAIGSGTVGYPVGGFTLGKPLAASMQAFMEQFYGKSGDTTGTNSGQSFSFKPYVSGSKIWGSPDLPYYRTWYAEDGGAGISGITDTNANMWLTYHSLVTKQEMAWDVLKKITRQGYAIDRSGTKVQFETYIGVSGDIHLRTSGSADFIASGISLIYYKTGTSGSQNNNIEEIRSMPWDSTNIKNYVIGWFPTWTTFPFTDDYSDIMAYSGAYWSGEVDNLYTSGIFSLSGTPPAPGATGLISIQIVGSGLYTDNTHTAGVDMVFTLWSGYSLNILEWNVSGGNGVALTYQAQPSATFNPTTGFAHNVMLIDENGAAIIKSGLGGGPNFPANLVMQSGWASIAEVIFTASGTFLSGTGQDGGWASGGTGPSGAFFSGGVLKQIVLGLQTGQTASPTTGNLTYAIDSLTFGFVYNFNPLIAYSLPSISGYGRRYEFFNFPYQYTASGAQAVVTSELLGKMYSRQIGEFWVKDNPNLPFSAQLGITPGQAFRIDAPLLAAGSGQFYDYWVANQVRHQWDLSRGFITIIHAYPWFSGLSVLSGHNMVTYSLTSPMQIRPQTASIMPNTSWWGAAERQAGGGLVR